MAAQKKAASAAASKKKAVKRKKPSTPERVAKYEAYNAALTAVKEEHEPKLALDLVDESSRPKEWNPKWADDLFKLIVNRTPIKKICENPDMPMAWRMFEWIADETHPFSKIYARGKQIAVTNIEEEIEIIAATPQLGEIVTETTRTWTDEKGNTTTATFKEKRSQEMLGHRELLINTLKWTLAHTRPKKHGRQASGEAGQPNAQLEQLFESMKAGPVDTP